MKYDRNRLSHFPMGARINVKKLTTQWQTEGVEFGLNAQREPLVMNLGGKPTQACLVDSTEFEDALMLKWHEMFDQTILIEEELSFLVSLFSAECRRSGTMHTDTDIKGIENDPIVRALLEFMNNDLPLSLQLQQLQFQLRSIETANKGYQSDSISPSLVVFAVRLRELIPVLVNFGVELSLCLTDDKWRVSLKKTPSFQPDTVPPRGIGFSGVVQ